MFSICHSSLAQNDTLFEQSNIPDINYKRLRGVIISESALYASSLSGLYDLWYKDYKQSSFHFFNDNNEWLQMDKIGHSTTAYYIGKFGYESLRWCNVNENKSILYGGSLGFIYLSTIEILDGFSDEWGFSVGDLTSNMFGSALFMGQQLFWDDQKILLKYSFHQSRYAKYRPELLGKKLQENLIKDYNGQTYWVSANIHSFLNKESKFPHWLNVAIGYSANGMIGAKSNPSENPQGISLPHYDRYRQFYLSLDIDLTKIKTNSNVLKILLNTFGFIKLPFPTLEYNKKDNFKFHFIYF